MLPGKIAPRTVADVRNVPVSRDGMTLDQYAMLFLLRRKVDAVSEQIELLHGKVLLFEDLARTAVFV